MILLFSGGLDSYIAWEYLHKPETLYFDIGHRYCANEVEVVRKLIPDTIIDTRLDLADWEEPDANIPMRNAFFIMLATHYKYDIVLVVQKGEMDIPDRCPKFFREIGEWVAFLRGDNKTITVMSPFFHMTKTQMVTWYLKNVSGMGAALYQTRSCYMPTELPCGACSACFRRWVAFENNGLKENHENPILEYIKIPEYVKKMRAGTYDKHRAGETFRALEKAGYKF